MLADGAAAAPAPPTGGTAAASGRDVRQYDDDPRRSTARDGPVGAYRPTREHEGGLGPLNLALAASPLHTTGHTTAAGGLAGRYKLSASRARFAERRSAR